MADTDKHEPDKHEPDKHEPDKHEPGHVKFLVCIDESEDCRVALRFAALRAMRTGGQVALVYVMEPGELQQWAAVGRLMEEEQREVAERLLQQAAEEIHEFAGVRPVLIVREGRKADEILSLIEEDPSINIMVLGAAPEGKGSNELVRQLTGELTRRLKIPLTIVPGNLTDAKLYQIT